MIFAPLSGPAASVGARLTLSISVRDLAHDALGTITFHATLLASSATDLAVPPAITANGTTYRIVDMRMSENAVEVHTEMSGALINRDVATMLDHSAGQAVCFPGVFLVDSAGAYEIPIAEVNDPAVTAQRLRSERVLDESRVFTRSHSGPYRVVVAGDGCSAGPPSQDRVLASWSFNG